MIQHWLSVRNKPNETKFVLIVKSLKIFIKDNWDKFKFFKVKVFRKENN